MYVDMVWRKGLCVMVFGWESVLIVCGMGE